jgi:hypothetical protein
MKILTVVICLIFMSCAATIKRDDVANEDCFIFLKCLEMNLKNPDKSTCAMVGDACREALRESRKR